MRIIKQVNEVTFECHCGLPQAVLQQVEELEEEIVLEKDLTLDLSSPAEA